MPPPPARRGLLVLAALSLTATIFAADFAPTEVTEEYSFQNWTRADGLPNAQVKAITQTRDGYLWVGTPFGLARFDGTSFTPFTRAQFPELPNEHVTTLAADLDGSLWVGTMDGLLQWTGRRFISNQPLFAPGEVRTGGRVFALSPRPGGGVWTVNEFGLFQAKGSKASSVLMRDQVGGYGSVAEDAIGRLWINGNRFYSYIPETKDLQAIPGWERSPAAGSGGLGFHFQSNQVVAFVALGHEFGQLVVISNGVARAASPPFPSLGGRHMNSVLGRNGDLWLSAGSNGLYRVRHNVFTRVRPPWRDPLDFAVSGFEDREGSLWIGTEFSGLDFFDGDHGLFFDDRNGLPNLDIRALLEARDGSLWLGTYGGGVVRLLPPLPDSHSRQLPLFETRPPDAVDHITGRLADHLNLALYLTSHS